MSVLISAVIWIVLKGAPPALPLVQKFACPAQSQNIRTYFFTIQKLVYKSGKMCHSLIHHSECRRPIRSAPPPPALTMPTG
jgi:hypothetical protein